MRVAVFCGSRLGNNESHIEKAKALGQYLAEHHIELVYGGGHVGLMGVIADSVLSHGGKVIGVIPEAIADREVAHEGLTELHIVPDMHTRKAMMADLSDGFIAMPGGPGTLEELFEVWTWRQLGYHDKPCAIYNVGGYYDQLIGFLDGMVEQNYMGGEYRSTLLEEYTPERLIKAMFDGQTSF